MISLCIDVLKFRAISLDESSMQSENRAKRLRNKNLHVLESLWRRSTMQAGVAFDKMCPISLNKFTWSKKKSRFSIDGFSPSFSFV